MGDFYQTVGGQRFVEGTMPRIAKALEAIGKELQQLNVTSIQTDHAKVQSALQTAYNTLGLLQGGTYGPTDANVQKTMDLLNEALQQVKAEK